MFKSKSKGMHKFSRASQANEIARAHAAKRTAAEDTEKEPDWSISTPEEKAEWLQTKPKEDTSKKDWSINKSSGKSKDVYMDPLYETEMPSDEEMEATYPEDPKETAVDNALNEVLDLVDAGKYPEEAFNAILDFDFLQEWGITDAERRDMKDYVNRYAAEHFRGKTKS